MLKETPELAEGGFIIPLDDHINEYWDEVYSDFYPTMFEAVKWDKQRWGIPQDATPHGIWYRKDVLRELGYTDEQIAEMLPATAEGVTMDDLKALAQEAVEAGLVETAFRHRPSPGDTVYIYMRIFGGRAFDPATGRLVLTKSAALEAFKWFKGLVDGGLLPMAAPPWGVIHKEFVDGEILFTFASHVGTPAEWIAKYGLTLEALEENLGFMVFPPAVPDATPITTLGPLAYLVTTQSEHPDIAALVLKFASDVDLVIEHSLQTMRPLIRKSALLHPNIQPGPPPEPGTAAYESYVKKRYILETTPMLEYAVDIPKHPDWGKYKKAVFEHLIAVETGKLAPQEAVEKLVEILKMDIPDIIIED
jgi:inositol-phosphate transport system substrate-binding protein